MRPYRLQLVTMDGRVVWEKELSPLSRYPTMVLNAHVSWSDRKQPDYYWLHESYTTSLGL